MAGVDKTEGHLSLGSGDFIGWTGDKPVYSKSSTGGGLTIPGDDDRAIRIAEIEVEQLKKHLAFCEEWIADMRSGKG